MTRWPILLSVLWKTGATWGRTADCPRVVSHSRYLIDPAPWHSKSCHRTILIDWHLHYGTAAVYNCIPSDRTTSHDGCMAAPTHRHASTRGRRAKNAKQRSIVSTWRNSRGLPPYKLLQSTHSHAYIDEYCSQCANRMSEVQPAEFIYYKYMQTHTCTLPCVLPGTSSAKKKRVNTIRAKGEERRGGVC